MSCGEVLTSLMAEKRWLTMMDSQLGAHRDAAAAAVATALRAADPDPELILLRRIASHDVAAMHELYMLYHRRLTRFLTRVTRRSDLAEEVINDTFFVVWTHAHTFREESRVSTWITGIAYRRALKSVRRAAVALVALDSDEAALPATSPQDGADSEWLERALEQLPTEQRLSLELAYVLGHSCEEIAAISNCSVNTVKTRLFHARRKLRLLLPRLAGESS